MPTEIHDRNEVRRLIEQGIQVVDVLGDDEYDDAHLPGAVHLPLRAIETEVIRLLDPTRPVLVYCFDSA
jgi:rhodanese-related sulfurtransferase